MWWSPSLDVCQRGSRRITVRLLHTQLPPVQRISLHKTRLRLLRCEPHPSGTLPQSSNSMSQLSLGGVATRSLQSSQLEFCACKTRVLTTANSSLSHQAEFCAEFCAEFALSRSPPSFLPSTPPRSLAMTSPLNVKFNAKGNTYRPGRALAPGKSARPSSHSNKGKPASLLAFRALVAGSLVPLPCAAAEYPNQFKLISELTKRSTTAVRRAITSNLLVLNNHGGARTPDKLGRDGKMLGGFPYAHGGWRGGRGGQTDSVGACLFGGGHAARPALHAVVHAGREGVNAGHGSRQGLGGVRRDARTEAATVRYAHRRVRLICVSPGGAGGRGSATPREV